MQLTLKRKVKKLSRMYNASLPESILYWGAANALGFGFTSTSFTPRINIESGSWLKSARENKQVNFHQ
jgi:hypothetical protein